MAYETNKLLIIFCGISGAITKFVAFFEKMKIYKNHQISYNFLKKNSSSTKSISKLVSNCSRLLFMVSFIKYSLKTIVSDGHFIFYDNFFFR